MPQLSLDLRKVRRFDETYKNPEPAGHGKLVSALNKLPSMLRYTTVNYMSPSDVFTNLLLDNPKVNFLGVYLEYIKYLRTIIDDVRKTSGGLTTIEIFGLDSSINWKVLDLKSHLVEISNKNGTFWEFISWDCPFVISILSAIQNNDAVILKDLIDFYDCTSSECATYIFEHLIRYAFDFRRLSLISIIIDAFSSHLFSDQHMHKIGDCLASLMVYFSENFKNYSFRNIINDDAEFVTLISILENTFPELYSYFQINWTGYVYHLVKQNNLDKLVELASKLNLPYTQLDYEVVVYATAKNKDAIVTVLLTGFEWNDRRDDMDKSRFTEISKPELEKMLCYMFDNMNNRRANIEAGFDPSFVCYKGKGMKESQNGINEIYNMHEKRFHLNIYLKALSARQLVMSEWCHKTGADPAQFFQSIYNDVQERQDFNNGIEKIMVSKMNRCLASIDRFHEAHGNMAILIDEYVSNSQVMYHCEQHNDPDVKVL
jgi:hypothetical protein